VLSTKQRVSISEISNSVYSQFRGPFTPDSAVISICLNAYAKSSSGNQRQDYDEWIFQPLTEDGSDTITRIMSTMGEQLGYSIQNSNLPHSEQIFWNDEELPIYEFFMLTHAIFSDLKQYASELDNKFLVYPNQLTELISFKLRNNPPLSEYIQTHFKIINYSQMRNLSKTKHLTKANLPELIDSILIDQSDKQFSLF
jgi:hypothetical protein